MLGGVFAGKPAISPATEILGDVNASSIDAARRLATRFTGRSILKLSEQGLIIALRTAHIE
jgi:hypothetical protein